MKNLCLTVLLFGASVHADILQVPTQYKTIQLAIDSATTGDAVHISSGTYYEKIDLLGKAIQVIGIDGPDVTTVDASGLNGSVVTCMQNEGPNTIIAGLTLTGGTGTVHPVWKTLHGGGVIAYLASPTIQNCIILENQAEFAGGMWAQEYTGSIQNVIFKSNEATYPVTGASGGLYLWNSTALVTDCTFETNTCIGAGAALKCKTSPTGLGGSLFRDCTFSQNQAPTSGGAVFVHRATPTFESCSFNNNNADEAGGAFSIFATQASLINCTFTNNSSGIYGGAIRVLSAGLILENCSLITNTAPQYGAGIAVIGESNAATCTLSGCAIQDNTSDLGGALFHVGIASSDIDSTIICGNGSDPIVGEWVDLGGNTLASSCTNFCSGDIDADGRVNVSDILDLIADFGPCNGIDSCFSDLNDDGEVNVSDILILIGNWGECQ